MALSGSGGACYRPASTIPSAAGLHSAHTRHCIVRCSAAVSTSRFRGVEGLVGNGQNPHDLFYWEHSSSDYAGAYHHRSVTSSYWPLKFTSLPVNQWVGLGITFAGTQMHGWKDGQLDVSNTTPGMAAAAANDVYADMLASLVYTGAVDSSSQWLEGVIAERAIWNVVLSADEMAALGKGFKPFRIRPQNLVFYAPAVRSMHDIRGGRTLQRVTGSDAFAEHPPVR